MKARRDGITKQTKQHHLRLAALGVAGAFALGLACSDDESAPAQCIGGDGAVATASQRTCQASEVQSIGQCLTGSAAEDEEHEHDEEAGDAGEAHEHDEEEEEHAVNLGREADDDDCKYHVSFTNTCVAVNQPVTFTLSLKRLSDGMPGSGTNPAYPEIFLESDTTHLSPSNNISAKEGPLGTYEIGPVVFDQAGRWVVRFHYFEDCSELNADSPHSHAAFYIDVPSASAAPSGGGGGY